MDEELYRKIRVEHNITMKDLEGLEDFEDEEYVVAVSLDEENNIKDVKIIESEKVSEKLDS